MIKKAALHNLGCKVNAYETEAMQAAAGERTVMRSCHLKKGQMSICINTCTVTNIADRKSRQMLHKAQKDESGCSSCGDRLLCADARGRSMIDPAMDIVIGNNKKKDTDRDSGRVLRMISEKVKEESALISTIQKEYEEMHVSPYSRAYKSVYQRYRMDAISSVLTASFRMQEDECEAVTMEHVIRRGERTLAASWI